MKHTPIIGVSIQREACRAHAVSGVGAEEQRQELPSRIIGTDDLGSIPHELGKPAPEPNLWNRRKSGQAKVINIMQEVPHDGTSIPATKPSELWEISQRPVPCGPTACVETSRDNLVEPMVRETLTASHCHKNYFIAPQPLAQNHGQRVLKRIVDLVGAIAILATSFPLMLIIAAIIFLHDRGPIIFRQERIGFDNKPFVIFKFRTVYNEFSDPLGLNLLQPFDRRVTVPGRFLRNLHLDELPQLLNVIRGEMSLVGPRPHTISSSVDGIPFHLLVDNYCDRHKVRPGIFGLAQMHGYIGPVRSKTHLRARVALDICYTERWSPVRDVIIAIMTIAKIFGLKLSRLTEL